jgi:hypothetical protein
MCPGMLASIGTWVGSLAVFVAVIVAIQQLNSFRRSADTDAFLRITGPLSSPRAMETYRLLNTWPVPRDYFHLGLTPDLPEEVRRKLQDGISFILTTYEHIGILLKRKRVNAELALDLITLQVLDDYKKLSGYVDEARNINPGFYENVLYLKDRCELHRKRNRWKRTTNFSEAVLEAFNKGLNEADKLSIKDVAEPADPSDGLRIRVTKRYLSEEFDAFFPEIRNTENGIQFIVERHIVEFTDERFVSLGNTREQILRNLEHLGVGDKLRKAGHRGLRFTDSGEEPIT